MNDTSSLTQQHWDELNTHIQEAYTDIHLSDLFADDVQRGTKFTLEHDGLYVDFSKNFINDETLSILRTTADSVNIKQSILDMFSGKRINVTEDRAVLHTALRAPVSEKILVDGVDVMPEVTQTFEKMAKLAESVRNGTWTGATGKRIKHIIHIGIGGSEIGPHMVYDALRGSYDDQIDVRFLSNVDPANFVDATRGIDPEETLCVVVSKSFTTIETLTNAQNVKSWILQGQPDDPNITSKHFIAVASNIPAAHAFGIAEENILPMWDWVGGRYSVMSAVGLSVMLAYGADAFHMMRKGAYSIDEHFKTAPLNKNIPITLALIGMLNTNLLGAETELILPYSSRLERLTTYLQQANMESNGKRTRRDGSSAMVATGPVVWGTPGTDSQHTFMQHVHQSGRFIPSDFIIFKEAKADVNGQHSLLLANALAQAEALAFGKNEDTLRAEGVSVELIPHKIMPGNQPSNVLMFPKLTPYTLGQLIATYEHKIFVQGVLWGVNSFDQWGVELGKKLAGTIASDLNHNDHKSDHDSSTSTLISKLLS